MRSRQKYLQKLYAILLLAAIGCSIMPLNFFHGHEGEHVLVSGDFSQTEHVAPGHQPFCPVCSCIGTQHYLPAAAWETFVYSFPFSHTALQQYFHLPARPLSISLRGPPACFLWCQGYNGA